jgi:acyl carrier protein
MLTDKFINVTKKFLDGRNYPKRCLELAPSDTNINPYNEWGFDSLDMVEYIIELELAYNIEISDDDAIELMTIGKLCDFCEKKSNGK